MVMFKHTIGDDALKVIKTFNYAQGENSSDLRVVMGKMEKHCIGEVNEIYKRYCFNMRDKLPMESVASFVAELRNLAKTCNFCACLRDSLIRDRIVLQGAKKIIFTACPSGKLKLAFTSPDVISTSPKNVWFFCYSNSS